MLTIINNDVKMYRLLNSYFSTALEVKPDRTKFDSSVSLFLSDSVHIVYLKYYTGASPKKKNKRI